MGAESDEAVAGIDTDVLFFEVADNFYVVFSGEEGECSEFVRICRFKNGNVVLAEKFAHFCLLGEVGGAKSFDRELFEVFESGEGLIGLNNWRRGFPPGAVVFCSFSGSGVAEEFLLCKPASIERSEIFIVVNC